MPTVSTATPTPNPVQQARLLLAQGFRVVPTDGKEATVEGFGADFPDFTCGPEWFGEPNTRVGVLCGPCPAIAPDHLICVDLDGPFESNPQIIAFLDLLPLHTLESHDGRHLFFRVAPEAASQLKQWTDIFDTKKALGSAVDLKWSGGYACESWDWASDAPLDALASVIAPFPESALQVILAACARRPAVVGDPAKRPDHLPSLEDLGFDRQVVRKDAETWLRTHAPANVAEGNGSDAGLVVAGALLVGFGLDDTDALQLMLDVWAPLAWPDDSEPEETGLERKVDEIDRLGSERFEWLELARLARTAREGAALVRPDALNEVRAALPPGVAPATKSAIDEAFYTWNAALERTAKGQVKAGANNIHISFDLFPSWVGLFGYDDFAKEVTFLRAPDATLAIPGAVRASAFDEDNHVFAIKVWISKVLGYEASSAVVIEAVHHVARKRIFHPVRDWLSALPPWDGIDRNLCTYLGAEQTPYHRTVCAKWLRSAVARAMLPGDKADTMLILEGKQGARKSTAIRCLCPDTRWFYEAASRDVGSKDFMQDMRGKFLAEIPEVDQLIRSRDESELKALLSRVSDNYRPSYSRKAHDFPRQLVFAGTTNHGSYLRDETGNRRYWAVLCGIVGPILDGAICDDRDQIWAQALAEYKSGMACRRAGEDVAVWWLTPEEDATALIEQEGRLEEDPWAAEVASWIGDRTSFTTVEALAGMPGAKPTADRNERDILLMAKTLRKLGWVLGPQRRVGGQRVRYWTRP